MFVRGFHGELIKIELPLNESHAAPQVEGLGGLQDGEAEANELGDPLPLWILQEPSCLPLHTAGQHERALLGPCAEINTPIPVVSGLLPHQDKIFQTHRFLYKQILKTWCKEIVPISLPQTGFSRGCEQAPYRSQLCFQYMLHSKTPGFDLNGIFILLPSFVIVHCFEGSSLFFKDMNRCNKSS